MKLKRLIARELAAEVDQAELRGFARSVADVEWLLLILALIFLAIAGTRVQLPGLALGAAGIFFAFALVFRFLPLLKRQTRLKIAVETVAMVAFISALVFAVPGSSGSLLALYLLPVIVAALTLGRWATLLVVVVATLCFVLGSLMSAGDEAGAVLRIGELLIQVAPFLLVAFVTAMLAHEVELARSRIRTLSETDELTGLSNLRAFSRMHRREHDRAVRHRRSYAVLVIDLDNLKQINDGFGHEAGNRAIVLVANVIARLVRSTDAAARFGGDEFVVLLSETDAQRAAVVAQRLRSAVARASIEVASRVVKTSVSVGVATFPDDADDPRELIVQADHAMYQRKEESRLAAAPRALAAGDRG